jgi:hypothetical protein
MADEHLSLETMAKWLSGRLEHEVVVGQIVPHLMDRCPSQQIGPQWCLLGVRSCAGPWRSLKSKRHA